MGEGVLVGIVLGFVIGILFDRYVLRAAVLPWLLSHGSR